MAQQQAPTAGLRSSSLNVAAPHSPRSRRLPLAARGSPSFVSRTESSPPGFGVSHWRAEPDGLGETHGRVARGTRPELPAGSSSPFAPRSSYFGQPNKHRPNVRCTKAALAWARSDVNWLVTLVEHGMATPLGTPLTERSADSQAFAAASLRTLALESDTNKMSIGAAGAIAPLVDLARGGDAVGGAHAAAALRALAASENNKSAIAALGFTLPPAPRPSAPPHKKGSPPMSRCKVPDTRRTATSSDRAAECSPAAEPEADPNQAPASEAPAAAPVEAAPAARPVPQWEGEAEG
jgi:hypothetical protein